MRRRECVGASYLDKIEVLRYGGQQQSVVDLSVQLVGAVGVTQTRQHPERHRETTVDETLDL